MIYLLCRINKWIIDGESPGTVVKGLSVGADCCEYEREKGVCWRFRKKMAKKKKAAEAQEEYGLQDGGRVYIVIKSSASSQPTDPGIDPWEK